MEEFEMNKVNDLDPISEKELSKDEILEMMKDPSSNINKPSEEEVEEAKQDFINASQEFGNKKWNLGDSAIAETYLQYLKHFIQYRVFWTKDGWMGVIKMKKELETLESSFSVERGDILKLDYQPLMFTYYMLTNTGGIGYDSALNFESEIDVYKKILEDVEVAFNEAQKDIKEVQFLQERWAAMSQGFYYVKDEIESEITETSESKSDVESTKE